MKHSESYLLFLTTKLWRSAAGLAALVAVLGQAQADTYVSGGVDVATWTKANSPYRVTGNIQVNGPLTIQPGVRVLFQGSYTFEVQGNLFAVGSASEPIVFAQGSGAAWQGILFNLSPAGSQLIHCVISNAANSGISLVNPGGVPEIRSCTLANNTGSSAGGLYALLESGDLTLTACTFLQNYSTNSGGAIWADVQAGNLNLSDCGFTNNSALKSGGAICAAVHNKQLRLTNCVLRANAANPSPRNFLRSYGGGVYVTGDSVWSDCLVISNSCRSYGTKDFDGVAEGGAVYSQSGDMALTRCLFIGNRDLNGATLYDSRANGGAIYLGNGSLAATNCLFWTNGCAARYAPSGGGIFIDANSPVQLLNCTFAYNEPDGLSCTSGTILNSIFYWNNAHQILGNPTVAYSDVQGWSATNGNIIAPPLFEDPTDLHLSPSSPCIDAGNPAAAFNDRAFPPSMRTLRNDMGVYGGPWAVPVPPPPTLLSQSSQVFSCPGQNVRLLVNAAGAQPLSYQWWFQDAPLPSETTNSLSLLNLTTGKTGLYRVVVTNDFGSVTSAPIPLIVNDFCVDLRVDHSYASLTVSGLSGTTAVLSYTTDLMKANSWRPLATNTLGVAPWFYVDLDSPSSPHRFYKATLAP